MKQILVIGANGFIAQNLIRHLKHNYDCYISAIDIKQPQYNIDKYCDEYHSSIDTIQKSSFDVVYHMASLTGRHVIRDPFLVVNANIDVLQHIIKKVTFNKLVVMSTSEVYGSKPIRIDERTDTFHIDITNSRTCYQLTKLLLENLANYYVDNPLIIRLFNTYGPYFDLNDTRLIPRMFVYYYIKKQPLPVYNGKQKRSWLFIDDFISILDNLVFKLDFSGIINIGSHFHHSVLDVVNTYKKINEDFQYNIVTSDDFEIIHDRVYDSQFKMFIKPFIQTNLYQGLQRVDSWFKRLLNSCL